MDIAGQLILGLGLFFLGMQEVGSNLRRLSGPSFRSLVARSTGSFFETGLLGTLFGALMQSATAVTFILVSMVTSGLIAPRTAMPIIAWSNVGLTVLAFVVALNIHPLVAYLVGLSAIAASMLRKPSLQAGAKVFLGVALIFFGLETMGAVAKPLVGISEFHAFLGKATASPAIAFLIGVVAAAVLQSNTASTLLVITLAGADAFPLDSALMLIYGTNLGAIALRLVLAAELRGTPLQLVRFEDLFCVFSGVLMVALFYAETLLGVPLVKAAIAHVSSDVKTQLAIAFLLSNLLPAAAISFFLGPCQRLLTWRWPPTVEEDEAKPKFISRHAVRDPETAMDLLEREISRYLNGIGQVLGGAATPETQAGHWDALQQLAAAMDAFTTQLSAQARSIPSDHRLTSLREELAFANYLQSNMQQLGQSLAVLAKQPTAHPVVTRLKQEAAGMLNAASQATETRDIGKIKTLQETTRQQGPRWGDLEQFCWRQADDWAASARTELIRSLDCLKLIAWMSHRLAKLLTDLFGPPPDVAPATTAASS